MYIKQLAAMYLNGVRNMSWNLFNTCGEFDEAACSSVVWGGGVISLYGEHGTGEIDCAAAIQE